ncbi:MAG: SMP-30/gluconolactonase/LRE family protein [Streptosporangiaceae bacterium]
MALTPDGRTLIISESFAGRLTTFDGDGLSRRRVFAESLGPDGICMDAEGAVWVSAGGFSVAHVAEGGKVLQRVELEDTRAPFALMPGGPDRRTLFICTAEWHKAEGAPASLERLAMEPRTEEILALPIEVPAPCRPRQQPGRSAARSPRRPARSGRSGGDQLGVITAPSAITHRWQPRGSDQALAVLPDGEGVSYRRLCRIFGRSRRRHGRMTLNG